MLFAGRLWMVKAGRPGQFFIVILKAKDADFALTLSSVGLASNVESGSLEAASIWRAMLAKAPSDAPWRPLVQAALARVGGSSAPALSDDAMATAKDMNETDRGAMIRGMVERLGVTAAGAGLYGHG
jgi:cytochrome c-type biogenesis protein CcmH